jgi:hypothetical protein
MFPTPDPQPDPLAQVEQALNPQPALLPSRIPEALDYRVRLTREERKKLGLSLQSSYIAYQSQTERRRDNTRLWREDVEMIEWNGPQPWPGAARMRAPLTAIACRSHSTKLNGLLVQANPPFRVEPRGAEAASYVKVIESFLANKLRECRWEEAARECHECLPIDGNCLVGVFYEQRMGYRPLPYVEHDEKVTEELLSANVDFGEALQAGIETDAQGQANLTLDYEEFPEYEGVELRVVAQERMIVLPASATDPKDLWAMGERMTVRGSDLKQGVREKRYIKEAVDKLLKFGSDAPQTEEDDDYEDQSGVEVEFDEPFDGDDDFKEFEIIELFIKADLNKDKRHEWYLVAFHEATGEVIRCQHSPFEDGKCPWVMFRYIRRPGRLFWQSVAERNAVAQASASHCLNTFHNLSDILAGSGSSFFYTDQSGIKPQTWTWTPGVPKWVRDLNGIQPMVFPQLAQAIANQLEGYAAMKGISDLLTSSSNPVVGKESEGDKTLGEVRLVANSAMENFLDYAVGPALCWREVMERILSRYVQYADGVDVPYQVQARTGGEGAEVFTGEMDPSGQPVPQPVNAGEPGFGKVPKAILGLPVNIVPAGLNGYADAETRIRVATMVMQVIQGNPVTAQNIPLIIEAMDQFFTDVRAANAEKLTQLLYQGGDQLQQQQMMQQMLGVAQLQQQEAQQGREAENQDREQNRADSQAQLAAQQAEQQAGMEQGRFGMEQDRHMMEMGGMKKPPTGGKNGGKR